MDFSFTLRASEGGWTSARWERENGLIILLRAIHMWIDGISEWNVGGSARSMLMCKHRKGFFRPPPIQHCFTLSSIRLCTSVLGLFLSLSLAFVHPALHTFNNLQSQPQPPTRREKSGKLVFAFVCVPAFPTLTTKYQQKQIRSSLARTFASIGCA